MLTPTCLQQADISKLIYRSGSHYGFCVAHKNQLPLEPVDHVSHQGVRDAGKGLLSQQDGLSELIQDHGVPIHLLLPRLELRETR